MSSLTSSTKPHSHGVAVRSYMALKNSKPTVSTGFEGDNFVLKLTAANGKTLVRRMPTLYLNKFKSGACYAQTSVPRVMGGVAPFVMNPAFVAKPWSSDPNGKNWDKHTNKPVLSWLDFVPPDRIGWETIFISPENCPDKWDSSTMERDTMGNLTITLPFYKDASGNRVDLGINGRGDLGRFGCNGAADPVVSRWSYVTDREGKLSVETDEDGNPVMQVVLITRKDTGDMAIPGGMNVDPSGKIVDISMTLANEFLEEVSSHAESDSDKTELQRKQRDELYKIVENVGIDVFRGRNGDPRNTNHAWMVTVCKSIHDPKPDGFFNTFELRAGSDASSVKIVKWSPKLGQHLYAAHREMVDACYDVQRFLLDNQV